MHPGGYFSCELLSSIDTTSLNNMLTMGSIRRIQDYELNSFILSSIDGKLKIPNSDKGLDQKNNYLVFQAYFSLLKEYSIQILVTCNDLSTKKLIFTNIETLKSLDSYALIPNSLIIREKWINLCIDIGSFIEYCFKTQLFTIDSIQIFGQFKLRLIFSVKFSLTEGKLPISSQTRHYLLPSNYDLPIELSTQIFNIFKCNNHSRVNHSLSVIKSEKNFQNNSTLNNSFSLPKLNNKGLNNTQKKMSYYRNRIANIILKKN